MLFSAHLNRNPATLQADLPPRTTTEPEVASGSAGCDRSVQKQVDDVGKVAATVRLTAAALGTALTHALLQLDCACCCACSRAAHFLCCRSRTQPKNSSRGCAPAPCRVSVGACGPEKGGIERGSGEKTELFFSAAEG